MRRQIFHGSSKIFSEAKQPRGACVCHSSSRIAICRPYEKGAIATACFRCAPAAQWRTRHDGAFEAEVRRRRDYMLPSTVFTNVLMVVPVVS